MNLFRSRQEVSRLEAFSDGVFAFSATLLVVSLEVPTTFPELVSELKGFVAFGISFAALVFIWSVHNAFFRRFAISDKVTTLLNACLLFVVLFYVYPLKFMADLIAMLFGMGEGRPGISSFDELATLFLLYSAGFVAIFLSVACMYLHVYRKGDELPGFSEGRRQEALFYSRHYAILAGVGVLSMGVALSGVGIQIGLPGFVYMLLGPLCYWHARASSFDESMLQEERGTAGD
ncbi:MAG: TMEM175 family protein [Rhodothermales bacterium]